MGDWWCWLAVLECWAGQELMSWTWEVEEIKERWGLPKWLSSWFSKYVVDRQSVSPSVRTKDGLYPGVSISLSVCMSVTAPATPLLRPPSGKTCSITNSCARSASPPPTRYRQLHNKSYYQRTHIHIRPPGHNPLTVALGLEPLNEGLQPLPPQTHMRAWRGGEGGRALRHSLATHVTSWTAAEALFRRQEGDCHFLFKCNTETSRHNF